MKRKFSLEHVGETHQVLYPPSGYEILIGHTALSDIVENLGSAIKKVPGKLEGKIVPPIPEEKLPELEAGLTILVQASEPNAVAVLEARTSPKLHEQAVLHIGERFEEVVKQADYRRTAKNFPDEPDQLDDDEEPRSWS